MSVALVNLPFASVRTPVIGISLLAAGLRRMGVPCDVHYLNLHLASIIGFEKYSKFGELSPPAALVGDWLFTSSVFPGSLDRDIEYGQKVLLGKFGYYFDLGMLLDMLEVRDQIPGYIEYCLNSVRWEQYRIVGFTTSFQQNLASLALAKRLKEAWPHLTIIFGGANCESEMGVALHRNFPFIDYVCSGEGDLVLPELVKRILTGGDARGIDGVICRSGGETVIPGRMVSPVEDMDSLVYPEYDDYFSQLERAGLDVSIEPMVPFETSRGCWWGAKQHCTFCGLNGSTMAYRSKSQPRALDELRYLGQRYSRDLFCVDNIFDLKYLQHFFPALASEKLGFTLHFETKVNLKKSHVQLLRDAGVKRLQPGIESFSTPILQLMRKGCTRLQNIQLMKWCQEYGVEVVWNFLYGFPSEEAAEYEGMAELIPALLHLDAPVGVGKVRMDRHSPYFTKPAEHGLSNIRPLPAYDYVYSLPPEDVAGVAYYFDFDGPSRENTDRYAAKTLEEVAGWRKSNGQHKLSGAVHEECLVIADTRKPGGVPFQVDEPARSILMFCDETRSFDSIRSFLPAFQDAELERCINNLISQRLLVKEGKFYLSLVVLEGRILDGQALEAHAPLAKEVPVEAPPQLVRISPAG